jgi:hydroxymethylglutaryl-CoA synthase
MIDLSRESAREFTKSAFRAQISTPGVLFATFLVVVNAPTVGYAAVSAVGIGDRPFVSVGVAVDAQAVTVSGQGGDAIPAGDIELQVEAPSTGVERVGFERLGVGETFDLGESVSHELPDSVGFGDVVIVLAVYEPTGEAFYGDRRIARAAPTARPTAARGTATPTTTATATATPTPASTSTTTATPDSHDDGHADAHHDSDPDRVSDFRARTPRRRHRRVGLGGHVQEREHGARLRDGFDQRDGRPGRVRRLTKFTSTPSCRGHAKLALMTNVGIDAIAIHAGKLNLDLPNTFAPAKDEEPEKYIKGLGLHASSLPDVYEDIVTMGANAAKKLMDRHDLLPADIGRIDVATESAFDNSKPVSTYIAGCLEQVYGGDFRHANKGERKFACVAGTQAIDDAYNWIRAGRNRGRAALVVATDTALYARGDAGEATQGAGAVAMLIDEDPNLVALSTEQGYGSMDETDFLKPNQQFPSVDGKRSVQVYLARMREALTDYESVASDTHPDDFAMVPFHTPFPGMVRKAALLGYRHMIRETDIEETLADRIGRQPREEAFDDEEEYFSAVADYTDMLKDTERYHDWYARVIDPTLQLARHVGNWYTGSVHVARASGLKFALENGADVAGEKLLVASYGSGAQAEVHHEVVQPGWAHEIAGLDIDEQLEDRYDISFEEYETVHDVHNHDEETDVEEFTPPEQEFVFDGWGRMGERQYRWVQ